MKFSFSGIVLNFVKTSSKALTAEKVSLFGETLLDRIIFLDASKKKNIYCH
ncbi:hypothetical protein [Clostridium prolinivorans]|uniref:hypothetical protein n=1 Tax=Clostridium prolinivorans TaxID=2769420 RepID=UPI001D182CD8|nr:hypothetical protein [Clostridium prolinivorans]